MNASPRTTQGQYLVDDHGMSPVLSLALVLTTRSCSAALPLVRYSSLAVQVTVVMGCADPKMPPMLKFLDWPAAMEPNWATPMVCPLADPVTMTNDTARLARTVPLIVIL